MVFRPMLMKLSDQTINEILDDLIYIKSNSLDKNKFRNQLIYNKLNDCSQLKRLMTESDINQYIRQLKNSSMSVYQLSCVIKKLNKRLIQHQKALNNILKNWEVNNNGETEYN